MRLSILKYTVFAGVLMAFSPAPAHADAHKSMKEESVEHYHVEINTTEEAFPALDQKVLEIGEILKNDRELEFTELESIHEMSYTLEAAIDRIRDEKAADKENINAVDEAVQALHFASENQEESKTREWFVKLKQAVADLDSKKAMAAVPVKKEFYEIVIKDHNFSPSEIIVPAGEKIKLMVDNQDPTPEEFESHDMNREKIIGGNKKATIFVGPLKPGKYHYFGEFNMDTANGYIIAK